MCANDIGGVLDMCLVCVWCVVQAIEIMSDWSRGDVDAQAANEDRPHLPVETA
jgi:hypothetical protein